MVDTSQNIPMPKKACMVTIMFPIPDNKAAYDIKEQLDAILKDIKDKRLTFQIIET